MKGWTPQLKDKTSSSFLHLISPVFCYRLRKRLRQLPKQRVEMKTPNRAPGQAAALLDASRHLPLRCWCFYDVKRASSAPAAVTQVKHLLTFTRAPLCVVSRRAVWNTVVPKQQVAGMLALQADTTSVMKIGHTVLAQRMAVWRGKKRNKHQRS